MKKLLKFDNKRVILIGALVLIVVLITYMTSVRRQLAVLNADRGVFEAGSILNNPEWQASPEIPRGVIEGRIKQINNNSIVVTASLEKLFPKAPQKTKDITINFSLGMRFETRYLLKETTDDVTLFNFKVGDDVVVGLDDKESNRYLPIQDSFMGIRLMRFDYTK